MLQNLPDDYSRDMVVELLDKQGFRGLYDFVYVPMNFRTKSSFGYAFINFVSPLVTKTCWEKLQGFLCWTVPSDRVCNMSWSVHQGLKAHIRRYRNSPVMHETVPDEYKPAVFTHGVRDPFPPPTKKVRVPRIRRSHGEGVEGDEGDMEQHGLVP
jgi:RNA recognition motif-containing protein